MCGDYLVYGNFVMFSLTIEKLRIKTFDDMSASPVDFVASVRTGQHVVCYLPTVF